MPINSTTKAWDALASTTLEKLRPEIADNIFKGNPLLFVLSQRRESTAGGDFIVEPLMFGTNSTVQTYSGYDTLDITAQEGITSAVYNWRNYHASVSISGEEERKNKSEAARINLLRAKVSQSEMSLRETLNQHLLVAGASKPVGAVLGLDEIVADVTTFADTLGGIASSTNTWWRNQTRDPGASWRIFLARLYMDTTEGNNHPDLAVTTKVAYANLEAAMAANIRVTNTEFNDHGFENIRWKGMTIVPDFYTQAGLFYMLNTNYLRLHVDPEGDFATTPFQRPVNQDSMVAGIIFMGAVTTNNRRFHGVSITTSVDTLTTW